MNNKKENNSTIKKIISVIISAQIVLLPLILFHLNTFVIYFLITNILISLCIGPVIIIGFILLIFLLLNLQIAKFISIIFKLGIQLILLISKLGNLPFSKIYVRTPSILEIIAFYFLIITINFIYLSRKTKTPTNTQLRFKYIIEVIKYKIKERKIKFFKVIVCSSLIILMISICIPKKLIINFVDVGQGDSCFIITPNNKTILIDGGGSEFGDFDVGKKTLLPYILDKGYTSIDYIFISHFDSDHVGGILTILEELNVGIVFISKQEENSNNYEKFLKIINQRKIKTKIIKMGDTIKIDNNVNFEILWPPENIKIKDNIINNNSLVMKLNYNNFSCLFTGDVEEIAEREILCEYKNSDILKSSTLKVAHHGSRTSTIEEFLNKVNPKIALIGVGKDNKFGHPAEETIKKLENLKSKIFRTDKNAEITLTINKKGIIGIKTLK